MKWLSLILSSPANIGNIITGGVLWIEGCQPPWLASLDGRTPDWATRFRICRCIGPGGVLFPQLTTIMISPTSDPAKLAWPFFLFPSPHMGRHRSCFLFLDETLPLLASSYMEGGYIPTTSVWHIFQPKREKKIDYESTILRLVSSSIRNQAVLRAFTYLL